MGTYLDRLDALSAKDRWPYVRRMIFEEPLPFLAELRAERPLIVLPQLTLATSYADCVKILSRPDDFGVDLYVPKQGGYFMAQDDTAVHWREKSVMRSLLDVEDVPAIRAWVAKTTRGLLDNAAGQIELVRAVTRGVPVALVQDWFGFSGSDPEKLIEWSYWNQQDAFWNQPFDSVVPGIDQVAIVRSRERANVMMALYLGRLVLKRRFAVGLGSDANDPVTRLVKLYVSDATRMGLRQVILNVGGLLIGAIETTSHGVCNALVTLAADPSRLQAARTAAASDDPTDFDGHLFEALRFNPAFPYFFRTCHRPTTLAAGTRYATLIGPETTVLAVTQSAMFDPAGFDDPDRFDPTRNPASSFTFGHGHHSCLGRHIAAVMLPEIARQILRRDDLDLGAGPDFQSGAVPQEWQIRYG